MGVALVATTATMTAGAGIGQVARNGRYTPASGGPPLPPAYNMAGGSPTLTPIGQMDKDAFAKAEIARAPAVTLLEELRASAVEVSKVKLIGQSSNGAAQPSALAGLQADLADSEKADATRAHQAMQAQRLAATAPKEQAKSKAPNEEFLATNAAASGNDPQLSRQMGPQATSLVSEGHEIRSVLLTRVNGTCPAALWPALPRCL